MSSIRNFHTDSRRASAAQMMREHAVDVLGRYGRLWRLYDNNELYSQWAKLADSGEGIPEALKPLRTVVNRSVEFYVAKVAPGAAMQLEATPQVANAIEQVNTWSNYAANKPTYLRYMALLGDLFVRVNVDDKKVWHALLDPETVTEFEEDSRGYLQWVLINIDLGGGEWWTEYWTKAEYRVWEHQKGMATAEQVEDGELGEPTQFGTTASLGIDFIPIVHTKFRDTGKPRGASCVEHALVKIEEANRKATRLAQLLFMYNKNMKVLYSDAYSSPDAVPSPPPSKADLEQTISDTAAVVLPPGWKLGDSVAAINYEAALAAINADMDELREDLPELRYYAMREGANISGKALGMLLGASMDRASEAQTNFLQGMMRVNEIALTMGQFAGLPEFAGLGNYADGDFAHKIVADVSFSDDISEKAATLQTLTGAGVPLEEALRLAGIEEDTGSFRRAEMRVVVDLADVPTAETETPEDEFVEE